MQAPLIGSRVCTGNDIRIQLMVLLSTHNTVADGRATPRGGGGDGVANVYKCKELVKPLNIVEKNLWRSFFFQ